MTNQAPTDLMTVMQQIQFEVALDADDPRYVDTREARGSEQTFQRLAKKFGFSALNRVFYHLPACIYYCSDMSAAVKLPSYASTRNSSQPAAIITSLMWM